MTNDAGAYTVPPLVLGPYSVTVDLTGFKKAVSGGHPARGGDQIRQDVACRWAGLNETVEVTGRTGLDVTQPDVSHTVNEKYYRDLPIITGGDVRLAESVLQMQPGYLPMKPNGDPMFRGSQFQSRINGGQRRRDREFLRWRRVRLRERAPAKPGEHASGGFRAGGEGHHDQLFGAVRPHQRRIHRVHGQDRHQCVSRQRLRVFCG